MNHYGIGILVVVGIYLLCAVICFALLWGFWQRTIFSITKWQIGHGRCIIGAALLGLLGPLGVILAFLYTGYGSRGLAFRFKKKKTAETEE